MAEETPLPPDVAAPAKQRSWQLMVLRWIGLGLLGLILLFALFLVGLNSDASVQRLKGPARPVNSQQDRALVLGALRSVDYVTVFEEDTPLELIKALQPDVLVKGGDYLVEQIVGADIVTNRGGRVLSLPFVEGKSTTSIIERMKK